MLARIATHNRLNGLRFSAAEFALIALILTPFGIYFLLHGRVLVGLVVVGIVINCLPVVVTAVRALKQGTPAEGWQGLRDPAVRERVRLEHPHLLQDTLMITGSVLLPFVCAIVVAVELGLRRTSPRRPAG